MSATNFESATGFVISPGGVSDDQVASRVLFLRPSRVGRVGVDSCRRSWSLGCGTDRWCAAPRAAVAGGGAGGGIVAGSADSVDDKKCLTAS